MRYNRIMDMYNMDALGKYNKENDKKKCCFPFHSLVHVTPQTECSV